LLVSGHDLFFLDYRACGKDGEPSVVNVDQEGDFRILPIADNFSEFVANLISSEDLERLENESKPPNVPAESKGNEKRERDDTEGKEEGKKGSKVQKTQ